MVIIDPVQLAILPLLHTITCDRLSLRLTRVSAVWEETVRTTQGKTDKLFFSIILETEQFRLRDELGNPGNLEISSESAVNQFVVRKPMPPALPGPTHKRDFFGRSMSAQSHDSAYLTGMSSSHGWRGTHMPQYAHSLTPFLDGL